MNILCSIRLQIHLTNIPAISPPPKKKQNKCVGLRGVAARTMVYTLED